MPISSSGLSVVLSEFGEKFNSPDLVMRLAEQLALEISELAPEEDGHLKDALAFIGTPEKTTDGWRIGVGNAKLLGTPETPAPRGTITQFLKDKDNPQYYFHPRGEAFRSALAQRGAWGLLPAAAKRQLNAEREAGKYGGVGAQFARYVWAQDQGNDKAHVHPLNFIDAGTKRWDSRVMEIVNDWWIEQYA